MNTQASSGLGSRLTPKAHSESMPAGRLTPRKVRKTQRGALFPIWPGTRGHTGAFRGMKAEGHDWWEERTLELCISVFDFLFHLPPAQPSLYTLLSTHTPLRRLAPELRLILAGALPPAFLPVFLVFSVISRAQKLQPCWSNFLSTCEPKSS